MNITSNPGKHLALLLLGHSYWKALRCTEKFPNMAPIVYLQGEFSDPSLAYVSLFDRGYLFGDTIFETLRSYNSIPFRLDLHLERLEHSAAVMGISIPRPRSELSGLVLETLRRSHELEAYVRVTISRGEGGPGLSLKDCGSPVLSVVVRPLSPYPNEAYEQGIHSMIVSTRRVPAVCLDSSIKCGNYLSSIMARRELDGRRMIEGIQLAVEGHVVCGTVSNLFLVCGDKLQTPDLASGCLPGITRRTVLELAPQSGLTPVEDRIYPEDLYRSEEMFFTNSLMELLPVAQVGSHEFPGGAPGPRTKLLRKLWQELVLRETGMPIKISSEPSGALPGGCDERH